MTETNFRALCAELLADYEQNRFRVELAAEARAALAQPEPMAPTDEELYELWEESGFESDRFARAVLARWGTPANTTREEN